MPGASSRVVGAAGGEMPSALAAYGSDSDSDAGSEEAEEAQSEEDEKGAAEREEIRKERNRETQRKLRMSNMGTEQRAKVLARYVLTLLSEHAGSNAHQILICTGLPDETFPKRLL